MEAHGFEFVAALGGVELVEHLYVVLEHHLVRLLVVVREFVVEARYWALATH